MFQTLVLAVVQGLTEFLPVSSSGHLTLAQHFLGMHDVQANLRLDIVLHAGTLLAVIWYFRNDLLPYFTPTGWRDAPRRHIFFLVFIGSIPTAIIGLGAKDFFESLFASPRLVCLALATTGGFLLLSDRARKVQGKADSASSVADESDGSAPSLSVVSVGSASSMDISSRSLHNAPWWTAIAIGIAQGMAITPGISRSGATIAAGLLLGFSGTDATRFSFLLMIPAVGGATLLEARKILSAPTTSPTLLAVGFLGSLVTGLLALRLLLYVVKKEKLALFSYYLFLLAGISLLLMTYSGGPT